MSTQSFSVHTLPSWPEIQCVLKEHVRPYKGWPSRDSRYRDNKLSDFATGIGVGPGQAHRLLFSSKAPAWDTVVKILQWLDGRGASL